MLDATRLDATLSRQEASPRRGDADGERRHASQPCHHDATRRPQGRRRQRAHFQKATMLKCRVYTCRWIIIIQAEMNPTAWIIIIRRKQLSQLSVPVCSFDMI
jgi:hypothetical protein